MRSLHYHNGGTLSPFPTEPEQVNDRLRDIETMAEDHVSSAIQVNIGEREKL
jgi:hypothetical protein